ncbi:MAG: gliding motility-associated C-terminal domain-containing protein, partial [Bacteroidetes bacterium]|nr:gliding motility-associated C-terminal domain-containing protein [Bacteroidota bacterium]
SRALGGSYLEAGGSIREAPDGSFIVGASTNSVDGDATVSGHGGMDFWLVKLSATGSILWQRRYGGEKNEYMWDFQFTPDGGYILAGDAESFGGDVSGQHGSEDAWVVKVNGSGDIEWQRCIGGSDQDVAYSVAVLGDGYAITGMVWSRDGDITSHYSDAQDMLVAKLDLSGKVVWVKDLGGSVKDQGAGVVKGSDGGIVVGGYTGSTDGDVIGMKGFMDFWLLKMDDKTGAILWQRCYGGSTTAEEAHCLVATPDGGYAMAGGVNGQVPCASPKAWFVGWVIKIAANGDLQWQKTLSGGYYDMMLGLAPLADGSFAVIGDCGLSNVAGYHKDADPSGLVGDAYIAKLDVSPTPPGSPIQPPPGGATGVTIGISSPSGVICAGAAVTLAANSASSANVMYQWFRNGKDVNNNNPVYTAADFANGDQVYCVIVPSSTCDVAMQSNTLTIPVVSNGQLSLTLDLSPAPLCSGMPAYLTANSADVVTQPHYQWQVNGAIAGGDAPVFTTSALVNGDVVSCRFSDQGSCHTPADASVTATVVVSPKVGASPPPVVLSKGQSVVLGLPVAGQVVSYTWTPATGLSDAGVANPVASPTRSTVYTLEVVTADGCRDTGSITVKVVSRLAIPGAFSPNGDGRNDVFYVIGGPSGSVVKDFLVFDRWGACVFQAHGVAPDDPAYGWDGRIAGQPAPVGTYVYKIRMGLTDSEQEVFTGTVVLIR